MTSSSPLHSHSTILQYQVCCHPKPEAKVKMSAGVPELPYLSKSSAASNLMHTQVLDL
jgi:hypothetical protein